MLCISIHQYDAYLSDLSCWHVVVSLMIHQHYWLKKWLQMCEPSRSGDISKCVSARDVLELITARAPPPANQRAPRSSAPCRRPRRPTPACQSKRLNDRRAPATRVRRRERFAQRHERPPPRARDNPPPPRRSRDAHAYGARCPTDRLEVCAAVRGKIVLAGNGSLYINWNHRKRALRAPIQRRATKEQL